MVTDGVGQVGVAKSPVRRGPLRGADGPAGTIAHARIAVLPVAGSPSGRDRNLKAFSRMTQRQLSINHALSQTEPDPGVRIALAGDSEDLLVKRTLDKHRPTRRSSFESGSAPS